MTERSELTRLSVNLNEETAHALKGIVERHGVSYTEAVRRAIAVYKYIEDETDGGRAIHVIDGDYERELILL